MRGRRGNGHHYNNGNSGNGGNSGNNGGHRRVGNPRMQTFDSNGPDVRIRGNATQINEKYITLARDASGAGDRVLAESYLQHAEHYQRLINEMNEEYNRYQAQYQQNNPDASPESGEQPDVSVEQPSTDGMPDLDQGFLVGSRNGNTLASSDEQPRQPSRQQRETESV